MKKNESDLLLFAERVKITGFLQGLAPPTWSYLCALLARLGLQSDDDDDDDGNAGGDDEEVLFFRIIHSNVQQCFLTFSLICGFCWFDWVR